VGWTIWGSNPGGGEIFRTCPDRPWGPPSLLFNGYWVFPWGKERPGRDAYPSPPSSAMVMKAELYLYSTYGPYGLYRASVPVQGYTLPLLLVSSGPGSLVGIMTTLRAGRSGDLIPVGVRFSAPVQTGPGAHPASCSMGTGSFPGVKSGRGVTLTPHPLLVPWS